MAKHISMPAPAQLLDRPPVARVSREIAWPPEVIVHETAKPLLTNEVIDVLAEFVDLFIYDARSRSIDFDKVELRDSFDPEDDSNMILVRMWVKNMSDDDRHGYYKALGGRVQEWFEALDERRKEVFITWISFIVWPVRNAKPV